MPTWSAEAVVDEALARRLIGRFPALEGLPLRLLSTGWDRTVWLVDERIAFGFPRRAVVVPGVELELEWLPRLAERLPRAIPVPLFAGSPGADFPWPFFGAELLPGVEAWEAALDDAGRAAVGVELAGFLRALHDPELAAELGASSLPDDGNARADMRRRVPIVRRQLAELGEGGIWRAPPSAARMLDAAERLPEPPEARTIAHGDLHVRHPLVQDGRLSGVIDWIDLCRGDPAIDLMLLWSFVPPSGRDAFLGAYGPVAEERLLRAQVVALSVGASLAAYGRAEGHEAIAREAIEGLERTLSE